MAQAGFTPVQLYYSTTATSTPLAANLAVGELAVNAIDGKLFYKNSATGLVGVLADSSVSTGNLPGGSAGTVVYQSATGVTAYLPLGTSTYILTSNGTGPVYTNPASITVGVAATATFATTAGTASTATSATLANSIAGGLASQLLYQSASGVTSFADAPTVTGTVLGWNGTAFAWVAAPAATSASNIAGGAQYQIPFQSAVSTTAFSGNLTFNSATNTLSSTNVTAAATVTGNLVTGVTVSATKPIATSSNVGAFTYGTLSFSDTDIVSCYQSSVNSYLQAAIQNTSNGNTASSEFIAYNDQGTATTNYVAFGINSSTYAGVGSINSPGNAFLLSSTTDLVVGTIGANSLRFVTNSNAADSIIINATSAVAFNGNFGSAGQLLQSNGTASAPTWINYASGPSTAKTYYMAQF